MQKYRKLAYSLDSAIKIEQADHDAIIGICNIRSIEYCNKSEPCRLIFLYSYLLVNIKLKCLLEVATKQFKDDIIKKFVK